MTAPRDQWKIHPAVWSVLAAWGAGVILIAALLSFWISRNQQEAEQERTLIRHEQDQAMCTLIGTITSGPTPQPGPAGERARAIQSAMTAYQQALRCQEIGPASPVPARD